MSSDATSQGWGKIILLGEHGVVYGKPGLAVALSRGAIATTSQAETTTLSVQPWGVTLQADRVEDEADREMLRRALCALLEGYEPSRPSLRIDATLQVPSSAGLGGSAALAVAMVRALDAALDISRDDAAVAELALAAERVFHGTPSGIDSAMAAHGGVALYVKGKPLRPVRVTRAMALVVGHSGEAGRTKETVASVRRQHEQNRDKVDKILGAMEAIVLNGRNALESGDVGHLGQLMDMNHKLLAALMLSTSRLEAMCTVAKEAGALGAKLTGGGGGGCMIALGADPQHAARIERALSEAGYDAFVTNIERSDIGAAT
jgi:mevalonate kinase